jgi:hypothetical protein
MLVSRRPRSSSAAIDANKDGESCSDGRGYLHTVFYISCWIAEQSSHKDSHVGEYFPAGGLIFQIQ